MALNASPRPDPRPNAPLDPQLPSDILPGGGAAEAANLILASPELLGLAMALSFVAILFLVSKSSDRTGRKTTAALPKPTLRPAPRPKAPPRPALVSKTAPAMPKSMQIVGKCYVIDGDTIRIRHTKIRLAGIDAPELDQPYGRKSKYQMVDICRGKIITAKLNGERSYDRLVGHCFLPDGTDIAAELVRRGYALDWEMFSGGRYRHLEPPGVRARLMWVRHNC